MAQNVLLIQADALDAKAVMDALSRPRDNNFDIEWVTTCALGLKRLALLSGQHRRECRSICATLVDPRLPDVSGIDTFDRLFAVAKHVPILILSSLQDEDVAKLAVLRGAQDYLLKERIDDYLLRKTLVGAIHRAAIMKALFDERERARITLNSIGDGVISTDIEGRVTYLNAVAERMTGWPKAEALDHQLEEVFRIIDAYSRVALPNPTTRTMLQDRCCGRPPAYLLIRRDGTEVAIEDVAPIQDRHSQFDGAIMVFRDASTAWALSKELTYRTQHDALTDLPNRNLLNDRLTRAIALARRHHDVLAVLHLDVDRFKHTNDSLGHLIGDRLLQAVALRLSDCVRACDTVSRLGGDQFVVLLSDLENAQGAAICAEKLLQAVEAPYVMDANEIRITASIGIGVYPEDGMEAEALIRNAESATYEAKRRGRNSYQFYRADWSEAATDRQSLESALWLAIERHEFELCYQPNVNLATGNIAGVEALIRWRHPQLGAVLPTRFIPVAEECGLIVPIGRWALRAACAQAKAWRDAGLAAIRLAVNVSAVELRCKGFVAGVAGALAETGFDAEQLDLEITETFLMQDSKSTALVLEALKDLGLQLALDDFGTGYSSLSYLRRLPINVLKIDQSFVRELCTNEDDASIVSAVISLGKSLHMRVVAEGVESREQLRFLEQHDCFEAQGYYFSRPLAATNLAELLRRPRREVPRHAIL